MDKLESASQELDDGPQRPSTERRVSDPHGGVPVISTRDESPTPPSGLTETPGPQPTMAQSFVYAIGRIEPRFPSLGLEKEFLQVMGRSDSTGLTDRQAFHGVVEDRRNRYLARQLCWVLTIEGFETYILVPRDPADFDLLIDSIRPSPRNEDIDVVVGVRGPVAPPEMCNGLTVPIVAFDQIYSFDIDTLVAAVPKPQKITAKQFAPVADELFRRIMQLTDNAGATDEHRALNYLAVRYQGIYERTAEAYQENSSLTSVEARTSRLAGLRNLVDVIFSYTHRQTDVVDRSFVRIDVTEEFPFLVTKMTPYFDR